MLGGRRWDAAEEDRRRRGDCRAQRGGPVTLPGNRSCRSRRDFSIHLRGGFRAIRVYVNGKRARVTRRRARIDLRGLPKGRYTVRIVATTRSGRRIVRTRYRTCVPRRRARAAWLAPVAAADVLASQRLTAQILAICRLAGR